MEGDALTLNMDCPFLIDLIERMEEKKKLSPAGSPVPQQLPQRLKKTPTLPFSIGPSARLN